MMHLFVSSIFKSVQFQPINVFVLSGCFLQSYLTAGGSSDVSNDVNLKFHSVFSVGVFLIQRHEPQRQTEGRPVGSPGARVSDRK